MTVLACDVGGTRIKLGLVGGSDLLARAEIPAETCKGLGAALERISASCEALCREAQVEQRNLAGFGLAFPGIIEPATDRILSTPAGKFDDAKALDTRGCVERLLGLPLLVCNDANAALAGEWRFGAARGCRSVVMLTLGTGVGTAVVMDGVALRGQHGQAGCLGGHLLANVDGRDCLCGSVGCVESEASTWALPAQAQAHPAFHASALKHEPVVDYAAVFRLAAQGDAVAVALRDRSLRVWAAGVVSLIHAYDPEKVVMGGGVMRSAAFILPRICEYVARHAWTPWGRVEVVSAALGNDAGLLGAAYLTQQRLSSTAG